MNDQLDRKLADYPEELPDILEPAIEEEKEEPEVALPVPSDLDLVQRYIREANRFALLTPEEEKARFW
ncbi:MAG: sigma-70 factor domain-containing protein [Desulfobaccales bacterium]